MKPLYVALIGLLWPALAEATTVPAPRLEVLSRGANITSVYERKGDLSLDLQALKNVGFRHVRVLVDENDLHQPLYHDKLGRLIKAAVRHQMGIIVCLISKKHPWTDATEVEPIWTAAWRQLALDYKAVSPDYLFFEMANEPSMTDTGRWAAIQERLRKLVRTMMPDHTLLLTGSPISMVWSLPPVSPDENVVYTWHLYQPMVFSHQGADWIPAFQPYAGLEYPPNATNIQRLSGTAPHDALVDYHKHGAAMMPNEIAQSRAWAEAHHAAVMVDEFGVYAAAPVGSRVNWLREARTQIEAAHEGWTVWEYKGGFGVAPLTATPIMRALGMTRN